MSELQSDFPRPALLSIIIPTFNEYPSIVQHLSHWQGYRQAGCELIIADGGSGDDGLSLLDNQIDKLIHSDKGRARQMNAGAAAACADWLLFLHVDTRLPADVAGFIDQLQQQKPCWGFFKLRLSGKQWPFRIIEKAINIRSGLTSVATGDQCLFVRADLFKQLSGFADIPLMEDVELSKRLRAIATPLIMADPVETSSRRWQHYGIVKTVLLMWRLRLAYFLGVSPKRLAQSYYGRQA